MDSMLDRIEQALIARYTIDPLAEAAKPDPDDRYTLVWERVERYAIDDSARRKKLALGFVDQGMQKFRFKSPLVDVTLRMAIEFFVRANQNEDVKSLVNTARSEIYRRLREDLETNLPLLDDVVPVADDVFVDRADSHGEGVFVFDLTFRTDPDDIRRGL